MTIKKIIIIFTLCVLSINTFSQKKRITREEYINRYKNLAIKEMKRTGIPASITLAQGILESDNGNSRLARKANNHFGIKCHKDWKGERIRHDDDKRKECFRKYESAYQSYKDHSNFLTNVKRYKFLFEYKQTDYKSWAKGLQKAGYATSNKYAKRLIKIIEESELYKYDQAQKKQKKQKGTKKLPGYDSQLTREVLTNNKTIYIIAKEGDTYKSIADEFDMMPGLIYKFNDLPKNAKIVVGQKIYLKPKRNKAQKGKKIHDVIKSETMYTISQKYAIKLKKLYQLNTMKPGTKISTGDKIKIRK